MKSHERQSCTDTLCAKSERAMKGMNNPNFDEKVFINFEVRVRASLSLPFFVTGGTHEALGQSHGPVPFNV